MKSGIFKTVVFLSVLLLLAGCGKSDEAAVSEIAVMMETDTLSETESVKAESSSFESAESELSETVENVPEIAMLTQTVDVESTETESVLTSEELTYTVEIETDTLSLLDAFLADEVPAFYAGGDREPILFSQLPHDDDVDYFNFYAGERVDLDNDGEDEQILDGPYGGMYLDARDGKVYVLAEGGGTAEELSYTYYDNAVWIVHSDYTHMGRKMYWLSRYDGAGNVTDKFQLSAEYWDSPDDVYDENSDFTFRDRKISMEEYEALREEIFGG